MSGTHTTVEVRRDVVHTIEWLRDLTKISRRRLLKMVGLQRSRYNRWKEQPSQRHDVNMPKPSSTPRILPEEAEAIIAYRESTWPRPSISAVVHPC